MSAVLHVRAFADNYIWLIPGHDHRRVIIVDPGDADPVLAALDAQHLTPAAIFCTHHHGDHSGGIEGICAQHDLPVYGPAGEAVAGVTYPVREGDIVRLAGVGEYRVLDVPGHTRGHIAFYGEGRVFCGDTLFSAGCGRLFEGTAAQMHDSLNKLAALPPEMEMYCGHEYTLANLRFAQYVEPENHDVTAYRDRARNRLAGGHPTLPSTIALERKVNPFLRAAEPSVRERVRAAGSLKSDDATAVFATLRRWKDEFKG